MSKKKKKPFQTWKGDKKRDAASPIKAKKHLGYKPTIDLEEGLKRSLIWYRENSEGSEA